MPELPVGEAISGCPGDQKFESGDLPFHTSSLTFLLPCLCAAEFDPLYIYIPSAISTEFKMLIDVCSSSMNFLCIYSPPIYSYVPSLHHLCCDGVHPVHTQPRRRHLLLSLLLPTPAQLHRSHVPNLSQFGPDYHATAMCSPARHRSHIRQRYCEVFRSRVQSFRGGASDWPTWDQQHCTQCDSG